MRRSKNHPQAQPVPGQFYQPAAPYGSSSLLEQSRFSFEDISAQPNAYAGEYAMPNPQAPPPQNAFFSPQTAFYPPNTQQHMPPNPGMPGMEFFSNNPMLNVGFNVMEQGMKDFTGKTVNMLPNEVTPSPRTRSSLLNPALDLRSDEEIALVHQILLCRGSNLRREETLLASLSVSSTRKSSRHPS